MRTFNIGPPRKSERAGVRKTDAIDATAAASITDETSLLQPRVEGIRSAISNLLTARQRINFRRTINRNALNALIRDIDLGIGARKTLTNRKVAEISSWREPAPDDVAQHFAQTEATWLATEMRDANLSIVQGEHERACHSG